MIVPTGSLSVTGSSAYKLGSRRVRINGEWISKILLEGTLDILRLDGTFTPTIYISGDFIPTIPLAAHLEGYWE